MRRPERTLLPIAGLAGFLALWQGVVLLTRPDPIRRFISICQSRS